MGNEAADSDRQAASAAYLSHGPGTARPGTAWPAPAMHAQGHLQNVADGSAVHAPSHPLQTEAMTSHTLPQSSNFHAGTPTKKACGISDALPSPLTHRAIMFGPDATIASGGPAAAVRRIDAADGLRARLSPIQPIDLAANQLGSTAAHPAGGALSPDCSPGQAADDLPLLQTGSAIPASTSPPYSTGLSVAPFVQYYKAPACWRMAGRPNVICACFT